MARSLPDKQKLLRKLETIEPEEVSKRDHEQLEAMSLGRALRTLAQLQPEHAYKLCIEVAKRAIGRIPGPELPIQD
jgi:uncharacterized protein YutE (UPF0331/DUF86 family)